MNTNFSELFKTFDESVTIRDLKNGSSIISGFGNGLRLSGVFNESSISANLTNKGEALYSLNQKNVGLEEIHESLSNIVNMFVKSKNVLENAEDFNASQDEELKEKELLLDDAEPVIDMSTEVTPETTEEPTRTEIEIREEPVPQDVNLEGSLEEVMVFRDELNALADRSTKLLTKFAKDDFENRLLAIGLTAGLYSISEDIADFIDNITEAIEDLASEKKKADKKDADKKENLSVPAKVDYMKMARGSISQACSAIKKTGECKDLLDILKDVKSEMVIRQK